MQDLVDTQALKQKYSMMNTGRIGAGANFKIASQMTVSESLGTLFHKRSTSQISIHAQKENEHLKKSMNFLDNTVRTLDMKRNSMAETERLLQFTKQELVSMSNKLSKIVAKNDGIYHIDKSAPSYIDIEYGSARFFRIPCKDVECPLKITVQNAYDSDYVIYYSRTCEKPDEENHNGKYYHPSKFVIKGKKNERYFSNDYVYLGIYR